MTASSLVIFAELYWNPGVSVVRIHVYRSVVMMSRMKPK